MKNEITKSNENKLILMADKNLSEALKPLSNEIHLFDTFVSGISNIEDKNIIKNLKIEDKLLLLREDKNYDSNNINIYTEDKVKIGFIPEKDNVVFARLMDAGKLLIGKISDINTGGFIPVISIGIYLVDY